MKTITGLFLLFLFTGFIAGGQQLANRISFSEKGFIENKGQVIDQHGKANDQVRFIYANGLFNLQLKANGFSYELFEIVNSEGGTPESGVQQKDNDGLTFLNDDHTFLRSHRVDVKLAGANASPEIVADQITEAAFNFYTAGLSESGVTDVHSYNRVTYKNIYPGIDLVFSAPNTEYESALKYEWILHPGADASRIKLQYSGATALSPVPGGGFQLLTASGTIEESNVIAFVQDDQTPVEAAYRFDGKNVSYNISSLKNKTVVIDPNIIWSTYYGGNAGEDIQNGEMNVDKQGKPLITGSTASTQYIASTGAVQTSYGGGYHDAFVAKFTPAGKLSWATYYGGTDKDEGEAVVADGSNNVIAAGLTTSHAAISTTGAYQVNIGGGQDAFVVKFNSSGVRLWATYFGGSIQDEILDLDCDALGNIYYGGYTISPDKIATPGAHQDTMNNSGGNNGDAFLGEFTPGGKIVWSSYFSGPLQDRAHGIAVGPGGSLYLQGTAESETQFSTPGVNQPVYGGGISDGFLAKWDTNGNFIWCTYYGGPTEDHGRGVRTDAGGNVYIMGWTDSESGIATPGAAQPNWYEAYEANGDRKADGYLAKFHGDGSIEWGTYYGGSGKEQTFGLVVDYANQWVYAGGYTSSQQNISTPGSFQPVYTGSSDGFLAKFTLSGTRIWGTYIGANDLEELHGMAMDQSGFLYMFLSTNGGSFSITPGAYQTISHGLYETLLIKFSIADACYDSYEPNNSSTAAKLIKTFSDTTLYGYTGAISSGTDADWFRFKLAAPTNLKIVLTDLPADYDLKLYKLNGALIMSSTNAGTSDEKIIYNNIPKASYLVEIAHSASAFNPNGCYRLKPMTKNSAWILKEGDVSFSGDNELFQSVVYPNPCSDQIHVKVTATSPGTVQYSLYNLLRQAVVSSSFYVEEGTQEIQLPLKQVSSGMYLLEMIHDEEKVVKKVIVE